MGISLGGGMREKQTARRTNRYESAEELLDYKGAAMRNRGLVVSSKGDVTATFSVPGLMTVPSDGASHNVTITQLELEAVMSWISVPKKSPKAHLTVRSHRYFFLGPSLFISDYTQAKIKNESEYTFLSGVASVYVDGSFISRSDVPAVSPQESFDCPLG
jgi:hypothetical protein